eukprot:6587331-Prymnesium_polylepis.1
MFVRVRGCHWTWEARTVRMGRSTQDLAAVGSLHGFTVRIRCETARNSCETAAKLVKHPVRNPRNETHRLQPSNPPTST